MTPIVKTICMHSLDKPQGVVRFYNIVGIDVMTAKRYTFKTEKPFVFKYDRQKRLISSKYTIEKREHDAMLYIKAHSKLTKHKITHKEYELLKTIFEQKSLYNKPQIVTCLAYKKTKSKELRVIVTTQKDFILQMRLPHTYTEDGWVNLQIATTIDDVDKWKEQFENDA